MGAHHPLLLLLLLASVHVSQPSQSLNLDIIWEKVNDIYQPRLVGLQPRAESPGLSTVERREAPSSIHLGRPALAPHHTVHGHQAGGEHAEDGYLDVEPSAGVDLDKLRALKASTLKDMVAALRVPCVGCLTKDEYVDAVAVAFPALARRSLENFLMARVANCSKCETREQLAAAALSLAHLPPAIVHALPIVVADGGWLFPCTFLQLTVEKEGAWVSQILARRAKGDNRLGIIGDPEGHSGILSTIVGVQDAEIGWLHLRLRGDVRMYINGTWADPAMGPLHFVNGTLFTDAPLPAAESAELQELHTRVRRLFFAQDTDAKAALRSVVQLPPPEEDAGPEAFSFYVLQSLTLEIPKAKTLRLFESTDTLGRLRALDGYFTDAIAIKRGAQPARDAKLRSQARHESEHRRRSQEEEAEEEEEDEDEGAP